MKSSLGDLNTFINPFLVPPGKEISLQKDYDPGYSASFLKKEDADEILEDGIRMMTDYQDRLYAQNSEALLVIFQAMDAAGKDGVVKHVMSGLNPQGCQVFSFKAPSSEELDHDYLWRIAKALPERGRIGIFNRSHYEEVLVVRVHPEYLAPQRLPTGSSGPSLWVQRFAEINNFEQYLTANGIHVLKFFLNVSKAEQKERFLERIERPEKNWKFSITDVKERAHWEEYMAAYQDMFNHTSTEWAPWHIIPADKKWFARLAVAAIIAVKFERMNPQYPAISEAQKAQLLQAAQMLKDEA